MSIKLPSVPLEKDTCVPAQKVLQICFLCICTGMLPKAAREPERNVFNLSEMEFMSFV